MKIINSKSVLIALSSAVLLIQGCSSSDELTRDLARQILTDSGKYPEEVLADLKLYQEANEFGLVRSRQEAIKKLDDVGFSTSTYVQVNAARTRMTITLTDYGQSFVRGEEKVVDRWGTRQVQVAVASIELGGVTGVSYVGDTKSIARVEYEELRKSNPLGRILIPRMAKDGTNVKSVTMRLYDDGWRIQR